MDFGIKSNQYGNLSGVSTSYSKEKKYAQNIEDMFELKMEEAEKNKEAASTVSGAATPARVLRNNWLNESTKSKVPYSHLAKDGVIEYNGVVFMCDEETSSICLGNMRDEKNVITIALSKGGNLKVHRDNLGDLSKAIGMFSPEDVNRILRAIAQDNKAREAQNEIEEDLNSLGDSADQMLQQNNETKTKSKD